MSTKSTMRTIAAVLLAAAVLLGGCGGGGFEVAEAALDRVAAAEAETETLTDALAETEAALETALAETEAAEAAGRDTLESLIVAEAAAARDIREAKDRACDWTGRTLNVLMRAIEFLAVAKATSELEAAAWRDADPEAEAAGSALITKHLAVAGGDLLETQRELRAECTLLPEDLEIYADWRADLASLGVTVPPWPADQPLRQDAQ